MSAEPLRQRAINAMPTITSRRIAAVALLLWIASLPFPGITVYRLDAEYPGFMILLIGWLSGNAAWFANLPLLFAIACLLSNETNKATASTLLAAVLSLDTFRMTVVPTGEGGGTTPVFGYGIGLVLWFMSICAVCIAASHRSLELAKGSGYDPTGPRIAGRLGFVLLGVVLFGSIYLGITDRQGARPAEQRLFRNTVFKRGEVCKAPDMLPVTKPTPVSGTLEIVGNPDYWSGVFWESPLDFLSWGQQSVRVGDLDYSWIGDRDNRRIVARHATGAPSGRLTIELSTNAIDVAFISSPNTPPVFSYHWKRKAGTYITCPELEPIDQPQRLVRNALALSDGKTSNRESKSKVPPVRRVPAMVREIPYELHRGCQAVSIMHGLVKEHPESRVLGDPLLIGDTIHFFKEQASMYYTEVICTNDAAYISHIPQVMHNEGLYVLKVLLPEATVDWNIYVPFSPPYAHMRAVGVREEGGNLWVRVEEDEAFKPNARQASVRLYKVPLTGPMTEMAAQPGSD